MVKMIKSHRTYNTDTATLVHYREGRGGDCYQGLYQNRDGAFFLWEYDIGAEWGDIKPLTIEEAFKWLQQHEPSLLEQYFPVGGAAERRLTIRLPATLARELDALADEKGLSLNSYVMRCFEKCAAVDGRGADAIAPTEVSEKIMKRSHQRSGVVAGGTLLGSGARQATVSFTPPIFHKLELAAGKNGVSLSEMVRQCVNIALDGRDVVVADG